MHKNPGLEIASNVRRLRKQKKLSLERVSRLADLSLNTVVKIASGVNKNPTIETLSKLAIALDVQVEELLK